MEECKAIYSHTTILGCNYRRRSTILSIMVSQSTRMEAFQFIHMKLCNDDKRVMFSIFGQYSLKRTIELDHSLLISFHGIRKSLIRSRTSEEIRTCMVRYDEELSLTDPWLCLIMSLQLLHYVVEIMLLKSLWFNDRFYSFLYSNALGLYNPKTFSTYIIQNGTKWSIRKACGRRVKWK